MGASVSVSSGVVVQRMGGHLWTSKWRFVVRRTYQTYIFTYIYQDGSLLYGRKFIIWTLAIMSVLLETSYDKTLNCIALNNYSKQ